jgi:hypothetical protein
VMRMVGALGSGGEFEVVGSPSMVDAWASSRLGFEPKGAMLEFRAALRAALQRLDPCVALGAAYSSPDRRLGDLENILFYNVGNVAFSKLGVRTLSFERDFASAERSKAPKHRYRYTAGQDTWQLWAPGRPVATWQDVSIPARPSASMVWAAMRTSPTVALHEATTADLVLTLDVSLPNPSQSIETMKKIIDGVIAAFHGHTDDADPELLRRLAVSLASSLDVARGLLAMTTWDLLDRRLLIHSWGSTLQWNPADDRLVAVRYSLRKGNPAIAGTLAVATPSGD